MNLHDQLEYLIEPMDALCSLSIASHINAELAAVVGPNPDAVDIEIDREDWKDSVGAAVYHLQGSEERFVDMTRAKRVHNIRRYFEKKKERYMMTMMGRLSDALNEVGTAFKELKDEQD